MPQYPGGRPTFDPPPLPPCRTGDGGRAVSQIAPPAPSGSPQGTGPRRAAPSSHAAAQRSTQALRLSQACTLLALSSQALSALRHSGSALRLSTQHSGSAQLSAPSQRTQHAAQAQAQQLSAASHSAAQRHSARALSAAQRSPSGLTAGPQRSAALPLGAKRLRLALSQPSAAPWPSRSRFTAQPAARRSGPVPSGPGMALAVSDTANSPDCRHQHCVLSSTQQRSHLIAQIAQRIDRL